MAEHRQQPESAEVQGDRSMEAIGNETRGYEQRDIHPHAVLLSIGGLLVGLLVSLAFVYGVWSWLAPDESNRASATPSQPLSAGDLQVDLPLLRKQLEAEDRKQLQSYGWIDKDNGVAHVPIQRAMEILAERDDFQLNASNPAIDKPDHEED